MSRYLNLSTKSLKFAIVFLIIFQIFYFLLELFYNAPQTPVKISYKHPGINNSQARLPISKWEVDVRSNIRSKSNSKIGNVSSNIKNSRMKLESSKFCDLFNHLSLPSPRLDDPPVSYRYIFLI